MRKYLLLTAAAAALLSAPAAAKDGSWYAGVDLGAVWANNQKIIGAVDYTNPAFTDIAPQRFGSIDYKAGIDGDIIGGYDFGMFRLEGEIGYKHAKASKIKIDPDFIAQTNLGAGGTVLTLDNFAGIDEKTNVWSGMINGWLDFGGNDGFGGGVGAGAGYAGVHQFGDSNSKFAWQLLAQAYYPVSENFDIGLKYRYFHAGSSDNVESVSFNGPLVCAGEICSGGTVFLEDKTRFTSHSLLLSLVYNFAPPPPPPPPATQTCPDGSVILATDVCPAPPPPPPPPPPAPERG